jgi:hypothetical protein
MRPGALRIAAAVAALLGAVSPLAGLPWPAGAVLVVGGAMLWCHAERLYTRSRMEQLARHLMLEEGEPWTPLPRRLRREVMVLLRAAGRDVAPGADPRDLRVMGPDERRLYRCLQLRDGRIDIGELRRQLEGLPTGPAGVVLAGEATEDALQYLAEQGIRVLDGAALGALRAGIAAAAGRPEEGWWPPPCPTCGAAMVLHRPPGRRAVWQCRHAPTCDGRREPSPHDRRMMRRTGDSD